MNKLKTLTVSIIIPCYNEKFTIEKIIRKINSIKHKFNYEVIVVDDFSTDGTRNILKKLQKKVRKVIFLDRNSGKGNALKIGLKYCSMEYILIQDADLEYDPNDYSILIEPILKYKADAVYGSRFLGSRPRKSKYFITSLANKFLTFLSNLLTNLNLTDMETGYKIIRRNIFEQFKLKEKRFGVEPEITAKLSKLTESIYEVGISYNGRSWNEGKKIGLRDGFRAISCIFKYKFFN